LGNTYNEGQVLGKSKFGKFLLSPRRFFSQAHRQFI